MQTNRASKTRMTRKSTSEMFWVRSKMSSEAPKWIAAARSWQSSGWEKVVTRLIDANKVPRDRYPPVIVPYNDQLSLAYDSAYTAPPIHCLDQRLQL